MKYFFALDSSVLVKINLHNRELALILLSKVDSLVMISNLLDFSDWVVIEFLVFMVFVRTSVTFIIHKTGPNAVNKLDYQYAGSPVALLLFFGMHSD